MARVLVMIPSGEVYNHDNVRWYGYQDIQRNIGSYHNIGDAFVYDSSLKLLNYDKLGVLPIADPDMAEIDRLHAEYDYVFLRGSNYINETMNWRQTVAVLGRLRLPVIAFGIGAQAAFKGKVNLSEESKLVFRMIADSTTSVGVRGAFSAQVLWDIGIRNVRIVGCPTAFRRNDPDLRIKLPPLDRVRRAGVTIRREVSPAYARDIGLYLSVHRDLIRTTVARFDTVLMAQGEIEEKKLVQGTDLQKEEAWATLRADPMVAGSYLDPLVERAYRERLFYSDVVSDYEALVRKLDLVLGYRLHGNLMALANGVPSIFFTYDSRTAEFAEALQIPSYDVFSKRPFAIERYWDQSLFDRFDRARFHVYREMPAFLVENGVDNKMVDVAARSAEPERKIA